MKEAEVDGRILELFRSGDGFVSGESLSRVLGLSRTAVWKHVNGLRANGYEIEAVPAKGYRLLSSPKLLNRFDITADLATRRIGTSVISLKETDSTNVVAFRMAAEEGAAEGTVVVADAQSAGKGRLGRVWLSPPGVNLYCSVVLRPAITPMAACQLTFLSAVAVARAIEKCTELHPQIKWPNDVLIDGKKVAGLLNEMNAETEKVNFVVLGIGVNVNVRLSQLGGTLRYPATSLLEAGGVEVDRLQFTRTLLRELDDLYDRFLAEGDAPVRKEWLERSQMAGRKVKVVSGERDFSGVVEGVDPFGGLLVKLADGRIETVLSGDVSLLEK